MVHGGTTRELLQLNEDSVWSGGPTDMDRKGASRFLAAARALFFAGKVVEGQRRMQRELMNDEQRPSHQTLGDLTLDWHHHGEATEYRRELDLDRAVATTSFTVDGTRYRQDALASAADQVLVVRLVREGAGTIDLDLRLVRARGAMSSYRDASAALDGRAWTTAGSDEAARHRQAFAKGGETGYWAALAAHDAGWTERWQAPAVDDSAWQTMELPSSWAGTPLANADGLVWFRRVI